MEVLVSAAVVFCSRLNGVKEIEVKAFLYHLVKQIYVIHIQAAAKEEEIEDVEENNVEAVVEDDVDDDRTSDEGIDTEKKKKIWDSRTMDLQYLIY